MSAVDPRDRPAAEELTEAIDGPVGWVALVRGEDRPGTLTALTGVFSSRGVSFESLSTGAVDGAVGTIAVTFTTTTRRQALLMRTVSRLAVVSAAQVRRADDPAVLAAAIVHVPDAAVVDAVDRALGPDVRVTRGAVLPGTGGTVLVEGSLAGVSGVVAAARERGAVATATVVLAL
ncbi:ACT domain-containing protein [Actinotalea sp.]|uniref:ACT domain-containing protein n=1 Tax=Actinotalea sp. TaxID=1872145 RepID=UPI003569AEFF